MIRNSLGLAPFALIGALLAGAAQAADVPVTPEVLAMHQKLLVLDTHLDTPALFQKPGWSILDRHTDSQVDYPRMQEGGLDGGFFAIYTQQGPLTVQGFADARDAALFRAAEIREMVARNPDKFELAFTAADAERIAASGKKVVLQSIENSYPLGEDLSLMATFQKFGVRMIGPVHLSNNQLGDSSTDIAGPRWNGLSPLGKSFVAEANRLGMVIDPSHASDDVLEQVLALSKTPVILSHSGVRDVFDQPRNVDDAHLKAIAAKGGVIQITGVYLARQRISPDRIRASFALRAAYPPEPQRTPEQAAAYAAAMKDINAKWPQPKATLDDFMESLLHALKVAGVDHVGVGADWDGGADVDGLPDVSALPKVTARLRAAGYSEADLSKIWGGNVLRVLRAAEAYAASTKPH
jgi:membrane dipeptidase